MLRIPHKLFKKMSIALFVMIAIVSCCLCIKSVQAKDEPIENYEAQWSLATKIGVSYPKIDYADDEIVIFHGYFGLFIYDLEKGKIVESINLEKIGCEYIQEKREDQISVSDDGKYIKISPLKRNKAYIFDLEERRLTLFDEKTGFKAFDGFVNTWENVADINAVELSMMSLQAIEFSDGSFGMLKITGDMIDNILYIRGEKEFDIFANNEPTTEESSVQSDAYYMGYKVKAQESGQIFNDRKER